MNQNERRACENRIEHVYRQRRSGWLAIASTALLGASVASAAVSVPVRSTGPVILQELEGGLLEIIVGDPETIAFTAQVRAEEDGVTSITTARCRVDNLFLECEGFTPAELVAIDDGDRAYLMEVSDLSTDERSVDGMRLPLEVEPEAATFNWLTLRCELELNDFQDCLNSCRATYPAAEGAITSTQLSGLGGCILICNCVNGDGDEIGSVVGEDTFYDPEPPLP